MRREQNKKHFNNVMFFKFIIDCSVNYLHVKRVNLLIKIKSREKAIIKRTMLKNILTTLCFLNLSLIVQ